MSEPDAFDRILESLHEATLDDGRWPTTSGLIDDVLRAKGNSLVFGAGRPGDDAVRIFYAGFFYRGQRHREWEREYFSVYYPEDERVERVRRLPDSQPVPTTDLYTNSELKTFPAYATPTPNRGWPACPCTTLARSSWTTRSTRAGNGPA